MAVMSKKYKFKNLHLSNINFCIHLVFFFILQIKLYKKINIEKKIIRSFYIKTTTDKYPTYLCYNFLFFISNKIKFTFLFF